MTTIWVDRDGVVSAADGLARVWREDGSVEARVGDVIRFVEGGGAIVRDGGVLEYFEDDDSED